MIKAKSCPICKQTKLRVVCDYVTAYLGSPWAWIECSLCLHQGPRAKLNPTPAVDAWNEQVGEK
jgi:hypothetical protein